MRRAWTWVRRRMFSRRRRLKELDVSLLRLNASPGGAADLLAVTLFLDRLEPTLRAQIGSL